MNHMFVVWYLYCMSSYMVLMSQVLFRGCRACLITVKTHELLLWRFDKKNVIHKGRGSKT